MGSNTTPTRLAGLVVLLLLLLGSSGPPTCPSGMVRVSETQTCIDRFEWPNKAGEKPAVGFTATPSTFDERAGLVMDARTLCEGVGKRMCRMAEWVSGCKGPRGSDYPFGNTVPKRKPLAEDAKCNYAQHFKKVDATLVFQRDPKEMARLYQADRSGARRTCLSASGAADMMGNVEEWVECPRWMAPNDVNCTGKGLVCYCLAGRFWSAPRACHEMVVRHSSTYHGYETGFRCCQDL